jgi:hypothetical protein
MGRSKAITWVNDLKNRGIKEFEFNTLPEDLKDLSSFRKAASEERIIKVADNRQWGAFWRIKN